VNKIYMGVNTGPGPQDVVVFYTDGSKRTHPLHHIVRHSLDGFQWGYGGSGPADLALSILCDCLSVPMAHKYYQAFKFKFVASADRQLYIKEADILDWIGEQENKEKQNEEGA